MLSFAYCVVMAAIKRYIPGILQVASRHGASNVRVFGSFAEDSPGADSDIDLLVRLAPGRDLLDLIALKQELEEKTGRRIDVLTEKGLSPHLGETILEQAKEL